MKKLFLNLQFIFKPSYWIMTESYSKELDLFMSKLFDKYDFESVGYCTATIGGIEIWVENAPYACMKPYNSSLFKEDIRPSRITIKRGFKKLDKLKKEQLASKFSELYESVSL